MEATKNLVQTKSRDDFGIKLRVDNVIADRVPVGPSVFATVFLTDKKQLFCFVDGQVRLTLSDVKKIASRMGLVVETFYPPKGQPSYFVEIGRVKFLEVFPGRKVISEQDLAYYQTLAQYSPALFLVHEVKNGMIFCADRDSATGWRPAVKFAYRRIRTS